MRPSRQEVRNNTTWHNDTLGMGFGELWIQFAEDNVVRQLRATLPPGSRWGSAGAGFRYRDPSAAAAGMRAVRLVPGETASARVIVRGRGTALPFPSFPLTPPVALQLRTDAGECWGATYSAPDRNDPSGFTDRND